MDPSKKARALLFAALSVLMATALVQFMAASALTVRISGDDAYSILRLAGLTGSAGLALWTLTGVLRWESAGIGRAGFFLVAVGVVTLCVNAVALLAGPGSVASKWASIFGIEAFCVVTSSALGALCIALWIISEFVGAANWLPVARLRRGSQIAIWALPVTPFVAVLIFAAVRDPVDAAAARACSAARRSLLAERAVMDCQPGCMPEVLKARALANAAAYKEAGALAKTLYERVPEEERWWRNQKIEEQCNDELRPIWTVPKRTR